MQGNLATLWASVDPDAPTVTRTFEVYPTGVDVPESLRYVGLMGAIRALSADMDKMGVSVR
jgi:hypothetical protein